MLVAMRAHSARPLPIPKCSSAVAATLSAPPAALSPVYTDVVRRESMAVNTLIGNFVGGNLAAAVSARERSDSRAISRDQAPATTLLAGAFDDGAETPHSSQPSRGAPRNTVDCRT